MFWRPIRWDFLAGHEIRWLRSFTPTATSSLYEPPAFLSKPPDPAPAAEQNKGRNACNTLLTRPSRSSEPGRNNADANGRERANPCHPSIGLSAGFCVAATESARPRRIARKENRALDVEDNGCLAGLNRMLCKFICCQGGPTVRVSGR
jgi:hypothetical protein